MIDNPDGVLRATICREPLFIYETEAPADVLSGIVITDWRCHLSFWIEGCPRIICESVGLAAVVMQKLESERCRSLPAVRVLERMADAA